MGHHVGDRTCRREGDDIREKIGGQQGVGLPAAKSVNWGRGEGEGERG